MNTTNIFSSTGSSMSTNVVEYRVPGDLQSMSDWESYFHRIKRPWHIIEERKDESLIKIDPSPTTKTMVSTLIKVDNMTTLVLQSNMSTPIDETTMFQGNTTMQYVNSTNRLASFPISEQSTTHWTRSIILSLLAFFLLMAMAILITVIFIKKRRRLYRSSSVSSNRMLILEPLGSTRY